MEKKRRGRPKKITEKVKELIKKSQRLKVAGFTYQQIGNRFGFSKQYIQQLLRIQTVRSGTRCEKCLRISKLLHCHHTNYETDEYQLLCVGCHAAAHWGGTSKNRLDTEATKAFQKSGTFKALEKLAKNEDEFNYENVRKKMWCSKFFFKPFGWIRDSRLNS